MKLKAVSFRVVVKPDEVQEKSKGGIVLAVDKKLERNAQVTGVIVDIGEDVYAAFKPMSQHAGLKVGDRVFYAKYAGKWIENPDTGENLLVLNDEDIVAKVESDE